MSPHAVPSYWEGSDFVSLTASLLWVGYAAFQADQPLRKLSKPILIIASLGLIITIVGGDILHNIFIENIQQWRCLWLARLFANITFVNFAFRSRSAFSRCLFIVTAVLGALSTLVPYLPGVFDLCSILTFIVYVFETRFGPMQTLVRWGILTVPIAGCAFLLTVTLLNAFHALQSPVFNFYLPHVVLCAIAAGIVVTHLRKPFVGIWSFSVSIVILIASLAIVDKRRHWDRFVEQPTVSKDLLAFYPPDKKIYWEEGKGLHISWFKMRKSAYYSRSMGSGLMFYRGTALEYGAKTRALCILHTQDFDYLRAEDFDKKLASALGKACSMTFYDESHKPISARDIPNTVEDLQHACTALPDLDAIILSRPVRGINAITWKPSIDDYEFIDGKWQLIKIFYKYNCRDVKSKRIVLNLRGSRYVWS